jgi:hypothetical protein
MRTKLTLGWRGKCAPVPDVIFDDEIAEIATVELAVIAVLAARTLVVPPAPKRTAHQQHCDNVVLLLDGWADWIRTNEPIAEGAPRQCLGAPDARINSFDDMEIEVNKRLVRELHTAVWDLPVMEREAVMVHYGLNTQTVWRTDFARVFDQAVERLFQMLKDRVAC